MGKRNCLAIWSLVMALFCAATLAQTGDLPAIEIPECKTPPILDGTLDDPAWQSAAEIARLYKINSDTPAPGTSLRLMRDNAWLYIAAQCANANMAHVAQLAYAHDGPVHTDDSLEIFLRPTPAPDAVYYHFMLNFAGIMADQRCDRQGLRDRGWNPPWRSVAVQRDDGWAAEIAIPLYCLGTEDLSGLRINLCRNLTEIILDDYGAKHSEKRTHSMLLPNNHGGFHDFGNFQPLAGLEGFQPEIPFAPRIVGGAVTGLTQEGGSNFYMLNLALKLPTPTGGTAGLQIREDFGEGEATTYEQTVELTGDLDLDLKVPAGDLRQRRIKAVLSDPADGNLLASLTLTDTAALNVLKKAFAGRSYYSVESAAEVRVELGLPANLLAQAALVLECDGKPLVEVKGLSPVLTPTIPLAALQHGDNTVKVRILSDGRELASQTVNIVRLEPRPGYETKADFIRGVILKEQEPIFPVGIYGQSLQARLGVNGCQEDDEDLFRFLAEDIGINTIVNPTDQKGATNTFAFMNLAEKYGLNVILWNSPQPMPMGMTPGMWPPPPQTNSLADRLAYQRQWYEGLEPGIIADTKNMREYKNLIAYYNVDEPNLVNPDERIAVAEWYYKTVTPLDPYRPHILLYAKHIPAGDNWTRWCDILAYDVYPRPYKGDFYSEPGLSTAYYAWQLRERCRSDNKIMWFTPLSNMLDPARSPIGLSKAHMICQAYSAIIYGVKELAYFAFSAVVGQEAWDALRIISTQVKEMTPALVNGDVPQQIKYTPDDFYPRERRFPMVNAAVFRYPDGDYLLLAVNIRPFAVDTKFDVGGLQRAARMFAVEGQRDLALDGESFTDKIEPYGARAYRIKITEQAAPVQVAVAMAPIEDERAPHVDIPGIVRQLMMSKNHMPNPCFEQQTNPGCPDFYRPYFCLSVDPFWGQKGKSDWFVDDTVLWNGRPSLRMFKRNITDPGMKTRGLFFVAYPPVAAAPVKMTFSFYARSEDPKAALWFRPDGVAPVTIGSLTADWQRHHFTFDMPPGSGANLGARIFLMSASHGAVIWISGLQLEAGEQPTEFQDDSVLIKKSSAN
ncbi:MAG: sugar-binding protein [Kiritimatiellia bacterium]|jgi:hypothetical protein